MSADRTVPQALGRLRVALNASFDRVAAEHGLSPQQAELLCAAMAPSRVGALAETLHCDRSNITRLADGAARHGWLARRADTRDARATLIELTPAGQRLARAFIAGLEAQLTDFLAEWSPQRARQATRTLDALSAGLEAADQQARAAA